MIEGGARGADSIAGQIADRLGLGHVTYHAKWELYGPPPARFGTSRFLDEGKPGT
jgi:hypothetical protein